MSRSPGRESLDPGSEALDPGSSRDLAGRLKPMGRYHVPCSREDASLDRIGEPPNREQAAKLRSYAS
jgi:hypothetical protein